MEKLDPLAKTQEQNFHFCIPNVPFPQIPRGEKEPGCGEVPSTSVTQAGCD